MTTPKLHVFAAGPDLRCTCSCLSPRSPCWGWRTETSHYLQRIEFLSRFLSGLTIRTEITLFPGTTRTERTISSKPGKHEFLSSGGLLSWYLWPGPPDPHGGYEVILVPNHPDARQTTCYIDSPELRICLIIWNISTEYLWLWSGWAGLCDDKFWNHWSATVGPVRPTASLHYEQRTA